MNPVLGRFTWEPLTDPIHGCIEYNEEPEKKIIDTPVVQRLRRLHQLQTAYFVYPGAEHTRFQHSLGTMHLSGVFAEALLSKYRRVGKKQAERLVQAIRITGLLHDIGHGPYSHAFDEAIIKRSRRLKKVGIESHEDLAPHLIEHSDIGNVLERYDLKQCILNFLTSNQGLSSLKKALRGVVKEWIYPADIMDFILRDAYFTGVKISVDVYRLMRSSRIYRDTIVMEERALEACKAFLYARFYMFENVYYHRTCRAIDEVIKSILIDSRDDLNLIDRILNCTKGQIDGFLELDDYSILRMILQKASTGSEKIKRACNLVQRLLKRDIPWRKVGPDFPLRFRDSARVTYFDVNRAKRRIKKILRQKLSEEYGESGHKIPILVDHTRHKYLPDNPFELTGYMKIFKRGKIEEQKLEEFLAEFLAEFPIFFLKFRIYTTKESRDKYPKIEVLAEEALTEAFRGYLRLGITY